MRMEMVFVRGMFLCESRSVQILKSRVLLSIRWKIRDRSQHTFITFFDLIISHLFQTSRVSVLFENLQIFQCNSVTRDENIKPNSAFSSIDSRDSIGTIK